MMNIICCVCKKKYGEKQDGKPYIRESHGYCDECYKIEMGEIDEFIKHQKNSSVSVSLGRRP